LSDKTKVWVIDPVESSEGKYAARNRGIERTEYSPDEGDQGSGARNSRWRPHRRREVVEEKGTPHLALLSYLAGPYAILTTRRGRDSRFWVTLAILSCIGGLVILLRASRIFAGAHGSGSGYLAWMSGACLAIIIGFCTWARAAFLLGRHKGWLLGQLPAWIRHPGTAGALGLMVPGFGLFIAGRPRRAAFVILVICAIAVSGLVLWQAPDLWRLSHAKGALAGYGDALERLFLVMGAIVAFGALVWIVQALDGARLAGYRFGIVSQPRGELAAVALIVAIAALLVTFKPAQVAETVDRFAVAAHQEGLRVIPLQGAMLAMRLDPSKPAYVVQAIEFNEALGRKMEALALRRDLADRWMSYERMLRFERWVIDTAVLRPENP
jgi:hypothetical protein